MIIYSFLLGVVFILCVYKNKEDISFVRIRTIWLRSVKVTKYEVYVLISKSRSKKFHLLSTYKSPSRLIYVM